MDEDIDTLRKLSAGITLTDADPPRMIHLLFLFGTECRWFTCVNFFPSADWLTANTTLFALYFTDGICIFPSATKYKEVTYGADTRASLRMGGVHWRGRVAHINRSITQWEVFRYIRQQLRPE